MFRILFFSIWLFFHPVHVTLTSIDYLPEKESFKVFLRMYFDDFLLDCKLNNITAEKEDFSKDNSSANNIMKKYLSEKVIIKVNEKMLSGKLHNIRLDDNEISMNMEFATGKKPKTVSVINKIMTNLYSDQSNMVIVRINDFEEGVKLTSQLTERTFIIK